MEIMGSLGDFVFGISADATYTSLTRTSDGGWVNTNRANQSPGSQNTGQGLEQMQIKGALFGATGQSVVEKLRTMQATRLPQAYLKSDGTYLGQWKMQKLNETQGNLLPNGASLKTEFTLDLERYEP